MPENPNPQPLSTESMESLRTHVQASRDRARANVNACHDRGQHEQASFWLGRATEAADVLSMLDGFPPDDLTK